VTSCAVRGIGTGVLRSIGVEKGTGTVVSTDFGEASDAWQNRGRVCVCEAPGLGRIVIARFQDDHGAAGTVTL
jgi:hypothetical protein